MTPSEVLVMLGMGEPYNWQQVCDEDEGDPEMLPTWVGRRTKKARRV
jgi:hypothetical protein